MALKVPGEDRPLAGQSRERREEGPPELVALYLEKRANLVRFFAARLGSLAQAEDLAQELYLKIAALPADTEIGSGMSLIYRIGSNLMLDRLRQGRRAAARDGAWHDAATVHVGDEPVVDAPDAETALAARQRLSRLIAELERLPARMAEAFRLHKLQGLSHAETARAMGVSVSAVEKHVSSALKTLLERLD